MNKSILMGRMTREPDLKFSASNLELCSFTIAVNRMKKGEADFISCKAFGKTAIFVNQYFPKGAMIALEGRIQTGSYTNKENVKVYTTDVMVDKVYFTGEKKEKSGDASEPAQTNSNDSGFAPTMDDDDLPF